MNDKNTKIISAIGYVHNNFRDKFGLPHQSSRLMEIKSEIIFEKEYRNPDAFRGIEEFSHIWIIWGFSKTETDKWMPTVRPPRLGGNTKKGVFATRSPFRPNGLAMSVVKLDRIEYDKMKGPVLFVSGTDMTDGTPVYDIKPYLPYIDAKNMAKGGFTDQICDKKLQIDFPMQLREKINENKIEELIAVLQDDPRPGYQRNENKVYGICFDHKDIRFKIENDIVKVLEIVE